MGKIKVILELSLLAVAIAFTFTPPLVGLEPVLVMIYLISNLYIYIENLYNDEDLRILALKVFVFYGLLMGTNLFYTIFAYQGFTYMMTSWNYINGATFAPFFYYFYKTRNRELLNA